MAAAKDPNPVVYRAMNAGVQKLLSLGASLAIGSGLGLVAQQGRSHPAADLPGPETQRFSAALVPPAIPPVPPIELPGKPLPAEAREFRQLSDPERAALEALVSAYEAAEDHSEQDRILDRIEGDFYGQELLGLALLVFGNRAQFGNSQVNRVTAILAGNTSPQILPVLKVAYDHASDTEKARLLMAAARVQGDGLPEFIARGFEDNSPNVRFAAFDVVDHQDSRMRKALLLKALRSSKSDVALASLGELEVDATPDTLPIIMEGLSSRNSEVREETRGTLQFLLDEEFSDPEAAAQWWQQNRHRFDRNLIRAN